MADELNFQIPREGFDSYLYGIIPDDQAVLAGAFSVAMQQVRNIQKVDIEQFAQVAYNIENMAGLPFVAGSEVPTDLQLATFAKSQTGLGGGVYGTFTMSNFFGCMSGLPYPLKQIYDLIKKLETDNLKTIYQNLYLAVTWNPAGTMSVSYTDDGLGNYTFTGVSYSPGGGYCRENLPVPTVTIAGATGNFIVGTDPNDLATYGKIIGNTFTASGTTTSPTFSVAIPEPPTIHGSSGWSPGMNTAILYYVTQANNAIQAITTSSATNFNDSRLLDTYWNITGTALKQEQRARYNFIPPVPIPYDRWMNISPTALYIFVDSIPDIAKKTFPHQAAQTLEHISNLKSVGGESVVGMMRQERNQARLAEIGIELDNNIPSDLTLEQQKMLIANGTLPGAVDGIPSPTGKDYTLPAWPATEVPVDGSPCDDDVIVEIISPEPVAIYDANCDQAELILESTEGSILPILENEVLGPFGNGLGPPILINGQLPPGLPVPSSFCGPLPPELAFELEVIPTLDNNNQIPNIIVNVKVPTSMEPCEDPNANIDDGINLSPPVSIIPPNLDTKLTGTTMLPSTYNADDAINKVIECNCDCWVN